MGKPFDSQRYFYYFVDIVLFLLCAYLPYYFYYFITAKPGTWLFFPWLLEYSLVFLVQLVILISIFKRRKLYSTIRRWNYLHDIGKVVYGLAIVALLSTIVIFLNRMDYFSRLIFAIEFILLAFTLSGWRIIKRYWLRRMIAKGFRNLNLLLIGSDPISIDLIRYYRENRQLGIIPVGYIAERPADFEFDLPYLGTIEDLEKVCNSNFIDEAILVGNLNPVICGNTVAHLSDNGVGVTLLPAFAESMPPVLGVEKVNDMTVFRFGDKTVTPLDSIVKRLADIVLASLALIVLSPVFFGLALMVKLTSRGPVFFSQKRVGVKGREFNFYKFRSMVVNAEQLRQELEKYNEVKDGVIFKMKNDPRITPIGHFLRKYSLDELPQLFNVLKGDMSIVGPRPPLMSEVNQYHHEQMLRLKVRPGLTGLPQIRGRSDLSFNDWVKWDLWYIRNWSLTLDLKIILATIPVVLKGKGAY